MSRNVAKDREYTTQQGNRYCRKRVSKGEGMRPAQCKERAIPSQSPN